MKKVAKTQSTFPPRVAGKPLILATQVLKRAGKWRKNEPDEGHLARTRASDCLLCMLSKEEGRNEKKGKKGRSKEGMLCMWKKRFSRYITEIKYKSVKKYFAVLPLKKDSI